MADFPFDVVAFDLDGTLVDSAPDLAAALNYALARLGRPTVPTESVYCMIGHGAGALLRKGLATSGEATEALVAAGFPFFMDYYAAHIRDGTRPYPGIDAALDAIAARGAKLAMCTNKPERLTHLLIDALGWEGRFDAVIGGDTLPTRKPDPAPLKEAIVRAGGGRGVLVGDSIIDADAARAAGLPFVAVSFGFADRPVTELGAAAVIDRYDQLPDALERIGR